MEYRREIDGLRALAVVPVILFHAGFSLFGGGFVGVDVFFVISGYLITSIIISEKKAGTFTIGSFYERRVRRILPALFLVIAVSIPLAWIWMLPSELRDFSKSLISVPLFASNYYFRKDVGYFAAAADEKPLLHTWSLAVEEQYYLFFPAIVCLLWGLGKRWIVPILALCGIASFSYALWQSGINHEKLFFDSRGRFWEILAGSFIAFYNDSQLRRSPSYWTRQIASLVGFAMIVGSILGFDETIHFPSVYTLIPIIGAVLIITFTTPDTIVGKILGNRCLVGIGLISYSAYLWHQPVLAFGRLGSLSVPSGAPLVILCLLSFGLAYLSWRFVEQPFRDRKFLGTGHVLTLATFASSLVIALGSVGYYEKGFEERFAGKQARLRKSFAKEHHLRVKLSRPGQCHYTGMHGNKDIDKFLKHWKCYEDPGNPSLKKIPVIVVGDSHAADIVAAFKMNGYLPVHMAGSGCSLIPKVMSEKCRKQFDYVKEFAIKNPFYSHILLVNRASEIETSPKAISAMIRYWTTPNKQLVYLTSRPEFPKYERHLVFEREPKADFKRATFSATPTILELLKAGNVSVISSKDIFCSLTPTCGSHDGAGMPLTTDGHHFSRRGAELFGKRIIDQGLVPISSPLPEPDQLEKQSPSTASSGPPRREFTIQEHQSASSNTMQGSVEDTSSRG